MSGPSTAPSGATSTGAGPPTAGVTAGDLARGRVLLLSAGVLWSLSGLILKSPPLAALPAAERGPLLACYRALFAAAVFLPLIRPRSIRWRPMLVPLVLSFAAMNALFVTAMTRTSAAAAIFLQYTSTAWAFVFGVLFLHERVGGRDMLALCCSLLGIGWIVAGDWGGENLPGNVLALGSGLSYAGVLFCLRWLRGEDAIWLTALNHAAAGLILLPWALSLDVSLGAAQWGLVAGMGVVQMGLPYLLFARAVQTVPVREAALLLLIEPVLNPLWVWLFWGERVTPAVWVGGTFILGGLAARYLLFRPERPARMRG
jgi:drug/metabolite transporter (DMT)-like permease